MISTRLAAQARSSNRAPQAADRAGAGAELDHCRGRGLPDHRRAVESRGARRRSAHGAADALQALSPAHREVLNETILRDRTVNQAAEVLGIPVGTVKPRAYYALRALRLVLAERGVSA
jgi:DNA-directed RNA polymerase specialized sigma24 family protein